LPYYGISSPDETNGSGLWFSGFKGIRFIVNANATLPSMYIEPTIGAIGMGTLTPSVNSKLDIQNGRVNIGEIINLSAISTKGLHLGGNGNSFGGSIPQIVLENSTAYSGTTPLSEIAIYSDGTTIPELRINTGNRPSNILLRSFGTNGGGDITLQGLGKLKFLTNNIQNMSLESNGNLLLGTTTDIPTSLLNLTSTTKGFIKPRHTTTQKTDIISPATGLEVYDTDLKHDSYYDGNQWLSKLPAKVYTTFASIGTLSDNNIRLLIVKVDETNSNLCTTYMYDGAGGIYRMNATKIN
jgi:hypothetical protein